MEHRRCHSCMAKMGNGRFCERCGYDQQTQNAPHQLPAGTVLKGQYLIGKVLGQGGFGITYLGWDTTLDTPVAIKEYYPTGVVTRESSFSHSLSVATGSEDTRFAENRDRFLREAQILAKLQNVPEVVQIRSFFPENNTAYIVMGYVEGITLKEHLRRSGGRLSAAETLRLMKPLLQALSRVHAAGLVHRDISPDNIMITPEGQVRLIDFGAAHAATNLGDKSTQAVLKHGFAPPEQYQRKGQLGPWTDVYAICATVYNCLTGLMPPTATDRFAGAEDFDWDSIPGLNPQQKMALRQGLLLQYAQRTQSVDVLANQLFRVNDPVPPVQRQTPAAAAMGAVPPERTAPKKRGKRPVLLLSAVLVTLITLAGALFMLLKPQESAQLSDRPNRSERETSESRTGKEDPQDADWPLIPSEPVTLTVIAAEYGTQSKQWWADFEKEFEAAHKDIDLVVDVVSWNDINTVARTRVANEDAPDILNIDSFAQFQSAGLLLPAREYISEETYAKFYPNFLEQSAVDGTVWAVPDLASARALYYNKDILEEVGYSKAPATWGELMKCAVAIKNHNPSISPWGVDMTTDEGQACFAYYSWNNGGGFMDSNGNWCLNTPENADAVEFITDMVLEGLTNPNPAEQTRYELTDLFGEGKIAMMIGPNSIPDSLNTSGSDINWGIAPLPTNVGQSYTLAAMDCFMCFDNGQSRAELAAITAFFDFFYEDTRYAQWTAMEGLLPVTRTGCQAMASSDSRLAPWVDILESAKFYPSEKGTQWQDARWAVISVLQSALMGNDIQELLDAAQVEVKNSA